MAIDIQDQWPPELQSQTTLPWSSSAQKPGVLQPEPSVGDEPLSGYRLFDIRPLVKFVEQFSCSTCQHSGYDVTEFGTGLATTVLFYMQGAAMKAGFCGIDYKGLMSAEKQVTDAAKTGRKRRQVVQAGTSTS
ncbi:hypothetical protein NP493_2704g00000 [Ridgeia piscesae]|uniref:Uncharacterized protein n=1 Tax=Ridgeia piscesae TaxID=27915 RepID=A0AAD9JD75_RIDPI|nr:hypothetical protein NP493_2704g00000 [Ridgeia piscesae]